MQGLIGEKLGMTQLYDAEGNRHGVTVLRVGPCVVVQRKIQARDGYEAVQLGFDPQKESRGTRALLGHFKRAGVQPHRILHEFALDREEDLKVGDVVNVCLFDRVPYVDIRATTKGRGFQGVVKRHRMGGGPASHGSMSHRRPGSIGQRAKPGRIHKGHRMPGHMGHVNRTHRNFKVMGIRPEENLLLVKGAVPGAAGGIVWVFKSRKQEKKVART